MTSEESDGQDICESRARPARTGSSCRGARPFAPRTPFIKRTYSEASPLAGPDAALTVGTAKTSEAASDRAPNERADANMLRRGRCVVRTMVSSGRVEADASRLVTIPTPLRWALDRAAQSLARWQ